MSFTARKWRCSTQTSKPERRNTTQDSKPTRTNTNTSVDNTIRSKWSKKRNSDNQNRRGAAFDSNRKNASRDTESNMKMKKNTVKEPKFVSKFIRKKDEDNTEMNKSTVEEPKFVPKFIRKKDKDRTDMADNTPVKTRTWKNKTSRLNTNDTPELRSLAGAFPGQQHENTHSDKPITSKWSKARVRRDSDDDGPFSRSRQQRDDNSYDSMKKSFNKKIVITERQTLQQRKAAEKAVYDSFIKDSYVLKIEHGEKKEKDVDPQVVTDCWDSLEELYGPDPEPLTRTEFDDWYDEFRLEIEGPPKPEPTVAIAYPWEGEHLCDHEQNWYIYKQLNASCMVDPKKLQVAMNFYKISKLDLTNLKVLNMSQNNLDELMDPNTPVHKCGSGKMKMNDFMFDYNILNLSKCDDKELRKDFMKLRKKHNTNQRIALKIEKNMKVQKNEMEKYMDRYKVEFLMERLMYFDTYFMDGELNFTNNYTPNV
jgi:hypothetical protein